MKVLFLDVDGVLNNTATVTESGSVHELDHECLARLRKVTKETGCRIILSSVWRLHFLSLHAIRTALEALDMDIYSTTPDSVQARRVEIGEWLRCNQQVERFAVLDDDTDADLMDGSFFQTTFDKGLTDEIAGQLTRYLNQ